ncbi:phosphate acetyltransferase [Spiroplasma culicicola]|uniref:Phosphate acetyltransferase n=1 Tax=Spiroplasma culicicola AES-1 TaxID=1276246 RepID=W6A8H4_9MOLU|nr:phosphate acetyltransferase [Spiroplasma culicicola]AHI53261.1 phosphotransacetylase [Spiroplasma culicicola AES-1]
MYSINQLKDYILEHSSQQTIVFPEGKEDKIVEVAKRIKAQGLGVPVLLFNTSDEIPSGLEQEIKCLVVKESINQEMVDLLLEIRKGKLEKDQAIELTQKRNYYGVMMIQMGLADAMVCGLNYTTADTLRPALQIIKTSKDSSIASSIFMMSRGEERYIFTDCALNVDPNPEQLKDIAYMAAKFAQDLNTKNVEVAMLSYSTNGSGMGPMVDKVATAVEKLKSLNNEQMTFDGEIQFDAAFSKVVRDKKYPNNSFKKETPDVFVFPELNSANIGYKIAQRLGGFEAAGPFILGLNKPVNDLSRGASLEDIYQTSIVTIYQAIKRSEAK